MGDGYRFSQGAYPLRACGCSVCRWRTTLVPLVALGSFIGEY